MKKSPAKQALDAYFTHLTDGLLSEPQVSAMQEAPRTRICVSEPELSDDLAKAAKLLQEANQLLVDESQISESVPLIEATNVSETEILDKEKPAPAETTSRETQVAQLKDSLEGRFQVLFFEVAGLNLAIPLVQLGGIFQIKSLNKLPAKPVWYMGMLIKQEDKYHCVDTARWVMPEKYNESLAQALNYSFAIQLEKSPWALACTKLSTTHELSLDDVKWREQGTNRPWLAGMIKQEMCALIDPAQLISLFESKPLLSA